MEGDLLARIGVLVDDGCERERGDDDYVVYEPCEGDFLVYILSIMTETDSGRIRRGVPFIIPIGHYRCVGIPTSLMEAGDVFIYSLRMNRLERCEYAWDTIQRLLQLESYIESELGEGLVAGSPCVASALDSLNLYHISEAEAESGLVMSADAIYRVDTMGGDTLYLSSSELEGWYMAALDGMRVHVERLPVNVEEVS